MKSFKGISGLAFLSLAVLTFSIVSCDKDDDKATLKFTPTKSTVVVGKSDTIKVSAGVAPYTAVSSDVKIATVKVEAASVIVTGVKKGVATVTVKDKNQLAGTLAVTVNNPALVFDKPAVEVAVGATSDVTVTTGVSPYAAEVADKTIATVTVTNNKISIKGVKAGKTMVLVTDKDKNSSGTIAVNIK